MAVENDEFQMTNDERNPKHELSKSMVEHLSVSASEFVLRISLVIRH
jgi:hypothetical protein